MPTRIECEELNTRHGEENMQKLGVFNLMTLDGYFAGQGGDISWHKVDTEFQEYAEKNSNSGKRQRCRSVGAGGIDR